MTKKGTISVDSGCIWIGDPAYFINKDDWDEFCDLIEDNNGLQEIYHNNIDKTGKGVVISNFGGDGRYRVKIIRNKEGTVEKAIIDFRY